MDTFLVVLVLLAGLIFIAFSIFFCLHSFAKLGKSAERIAEVGLLASSFLYIFVTLLILGVSHWGR